MKLDYAINRIHCIHPFGISRSTHDYYDIVYIYIEKDGIIGKGEAAPSNRYGEHTQDIVSALNEGIHIDERMIDIDNFIQNVTPQCKNIKSLEVAISMALLDWYCQYKQLPLYRFFNASRNNTPNTSYTISIGDMALIPEKIKESKPYKIIKVKLGVSKEKDKEIINSIRECTDTLIRVDANEGWDLDTGLEMSRWLADRNIEFIEQPFHSTNLKDTAELKKKSPLPLIADENSINSNDVKTLKGVFDGINIKLMKCGNLFEAKKMIDLARENQMKVMIGCMIESSVAITAASHLSPLVDFADLDGNLLIKDDPYVGVKIIDGKIILPKANGLGVKLSKAATNNKLK